MGRVLNTAVFRLKLFCFFLSVVVVCSLPAQNGTWTWMAGLSTSNSFGNFGTQGVAAASNHPPALYTPLKWTDLNGNLWILGGISSPFVNQTALWKYDITTGLWTWMKGPSNAVSAGVYGTMGVPSPSNYPGSRYGTGITWVDTNGDLWLFGGYGRDGFSNPGVLSDLWKYNIATNEWTWMNGSNSGNQPGNFGTLQVPAATNQPPGRYEVASNWIDNTGNFWMFSGGRFSTTSTSDDMWMYNVSTNQWTWMSGQQNGPVAASHGTLQVAAATNTPGSRLVYAKWKDASGNFWLYGGRTSPFSTINIMADMWMYNPITNLWTWMAGSNAINSGNTIAQQCTPGNADPAGTWDNYCSWTDDCGRFWLNGGQSNTGTAGMTWMFDPTTLQFTWITGQASMNGSGVFGTQNVPAAANTPPALRGQVAFQSSNGDLWLFGGSNSSFTQYYNAVWRYQIDPTCPTINITAGMTASPTSGCAPFTPTLAATTANASIYHWNFGDPNTLADTSNLQNPSWTYAQSGTYTVTLIVTGSSSCSVGSTDTTTTVITVTGLPVVDLGADTIFCSSAINFPLNAGNTGMTYQWSTGATSQTISATSAGTYFVTVSNGSSAACSDRDTIVIGMAVQPNIGNDTNFCAGQTITLATALLGSYLWNTGDTTASISVSTSGNYSVRVTNQNCSNTDTVTITVNTLPGVNLGADTLLCSSTSSLVLDAGNPGMNYAWSTGATSQNITAALAGTYSVTVTNAANSSCQDQDTITVAYAAQPNLGSDTTICSGQTIMLNPGIPGSYLWNTGDTTSSIVAASTGLYSVQVTNAPCVNFTAINVTVNPTPIVDLGNDTLLCPNITLVLDAQNLGATYAWNNNTTAQSITIDSSGLYAVNVTNNNCTAQDSIEVTYSEAVQLSDEATICGTLNGIELDAGIQGTNVNYLWSNGESTQTILVDKAGTYSVTVTNGSCTIIDSTIVTGELGKSMLFVPNSFSPDGNGLNEVFTPMGEDVGEFSMLIFDRWGNKVFESNDVTIGWDGRYKGTLSSGGVYVYIIEYSPDCARGRKQRKTGHITVIR